MPHVYTEAAKWPKTLTNVVVFRPSTGERTVVAHGIVDDEAARKIAAELRGAFADAFHTGSAEAHESMRKSMSTAATPIMDADERWYAMNDGWVD